MSVRLPLGALCCLQTSLVLFMAFKVLRCPNVLVNDCNLLFTWSEIRLNMLMVL